MCSVYVQLECVVGPFWLTAVMQVGCWLLCVYGVFCVGAQSLNVLCAALGVPELVPF